MFENDVTGVTALTVALGLYAWRKADAVSFDAAEAKVKAEFEAIKASALAAEPDFLAFLQPDEIEPPPPEKGRIEIEKQTVPNGDPATFGFTGEINATLGDGESAWKEVDAGTYNVSETALEGWTLTDIECNDANSTTAGSTATFKVEAGETVRCVFTSTKDDEPPPVDDEPTWTDDVPPVLFKEGEAGTYPLVYLHTDNFIDTKHRLGLKTGTLPPAMTLGAKNLSYSGVGPVNTNISVQIEDIPVEPPIEPSAAGHRRLEHPQHCTGHHFCGPARDVAAMESKQRSSSRSDRQWFVVWQE